MSKKSKKNNKKRINKQSKKQSKKQSSKVGYCNPPKEHQFKPGQSGNPKGRPKKITSVKEGIEVWLGKSVRVRDESGKIRNITCAEAIANKSLATAIETDGPTRRLFLQKGLFELCSKEQEMEYDPDEEELMRVEKVYGECLRNWAEAPEHIREIMLRIISELLTEYANERFRK